MKIYTITSFLFILLFSPSLVAQEYFNNQLTYAEIDSIQIELYNKGDYNSCAIFTEKVLTKVAKEFGKEDTLYAFYQNDLGSFYYELGAYKKSAFHYFSAQNILKNKIGRHDINYIKALNGLGAAYQMSDRYTEAESIFIELEDIITKQWSTNPNLFAIILNNCARLYWMNKQYKKAEKLLIKTKDIQKQNLGEFDKDYAITLSNLAILYKDLKEYDKAAPLFEKVKEIRLKILGASHPYYAVGLHDLGAFYILAKKYDASEKLLQEALLIQTKVWGIKHYQCARTLLTLGDLYFNQHNWQQSEHYLIQSLLSNTNVASDSFSLDKIHEYDYFSNSLFHLTIQKLLSIYELQYQNGDKQKIEEYYALVQKSIALGEKWKNSFDSDQNKLKSLKSNFLLIEKGIEAALIIDTDAAIKESFRFAEQNKSILLTDAIKGTAARSLGYLPDSLGNIEVMLQKELHQLKNKRLRIRSKEERTHLNRAILDLELQRNKFIEQIKKNYPKYYALKYQDISVSVETIQQQLDDKTLLLEYFVTDTILYLFSISKTKINVYPINIDAKDWMLKLNVNRQALTDFNWIVNHMDKAYENYTSTAHWLYNNILAMALEGNNKINRLIIITDRELGYLPFETLLTAPAPASASYQSLPYLLNQYTISYDYSATLWKQNLATISQAKYNSQILAYAPAYHQPDSANIIHTRSQEYRIRQLLEPLKSAKEEVQKLSELYAGNFIFGTDANEHSFKIKASDYGIIHLAMHGVVNAEQPMLSSLVFSENYDSLENNFLYAYEVSKLNLNANLAVLSACETGYGEFQQGEGIISLGRSFMYAGVPSLVVSLWSVNDFSTAHIIRNFYHNLSTGMPKDEALRQAKISYLKQKNGLVAHPAFWSAFIHIGNHQPISIHQESDSMGYIWGGGLFILLLLFVITKQLGKKEKYT